MNRLKTFDQLNNHASILLATRRKDGERIDPLVRFKLVDRVRQRFLDICGGYTDLGNVEGAWIDDEGNVHYEKLRKIEGYFGAGNEDSTIQLGNEDSTIQLLILLAEYVAVELDQYAVSLEVNNVLYFVTQR